MRRLALVLALVSFTAAAADPIPADAPVILEKGDAAPARGLFSPEALAIRDDKDHRACLVERDDLRAKAAPLWWVPVVVGVVALGMGVTFGYGVATAKGGKP